MRFSDCLHSALQGARLPHPLRRSAAKAALGLIGLAALPLLAGGPAALGPALKTTAALALACALAWLALRTLARRGPLAAAESELKVVARTALTPKSGVALLEVEGRRYLVAFGDGFATLLSQESAGGDR